MTDCNDESVVRLRSLIELFCCKIGDLLTVWKHLMMPAVDQLADMAANRELLLGGGGRVKVRSVPHPGYLPRAEVVRLVVAHEESGVDPDDDTPAAHDVLRKALGASWYEHLAREGEEVTGWLIEFAASTRYRTVQIGFVELYSTIEWWYSEVRRALGIAGEWRNYQQLTSPIARRFGVKQLGELRRGEPGEWAIDLIRFISNDVKHHGGNAHQSSELLGITPRSALELTITGFEMCCVNAIAYARLLTSELIDRLGGTPEDGQDYDSPEHPSTSPSRFWLGRFVDSKYMLPERIVPSPTFLAVPGARRVKRKRRAPGRRS